MTWLGKIGDVLGGTEPVLFWRLIEIINFQKKGSRRNYRDAYAMDSKKFEVIKKTT